MNFELNEEQQMVKSSVREFARNEIAPRAREYDEAEKF
ncbi:MAG: acyl-CoA dehydrogenase family protein, partial [Actinomycetota bacterium]